MFAAALRDGVFGLDGVRCDGSIFIRLVDATSQAAHPLPACVMRCGTCGRHGWGGAERCARAGLCGRQVPAGDPVPVVIPIPESAAHATLGFYEESVRMGRPCTVDLGFFRNPYVGRSFISPSQELRDLKVLCKFNPM